MIKQNKQKIEWCKDNNITIIGDMEIVRELTSIAETIRKKVQIPTRQPLNDFAFGYTDDKRRFWLDKGLIEILAGAINIHNLGYSFSDKNWYWLQDIEKPNEENWEYLEKNGLWVSLYIKMEPWLEEIGNNAKKRRQQIIKNKLINN